MQTCKWTGPAVLLLVLLSSCGRVHAKEYNFDNAFYNQQLLEQVDDVLQPWRHARTGGDGSGERPRYRYKDGVLVARWYPTRRGEVAQYQWSWEIPPGVNHSAKLWWEPYYQVGYGCGYGRNGYRCYGGYEGRRRYYSNRYRDRRYGYRGDGRYNYGGRYRARGGYGGRYNGGYDSRRGYSTITGGGMAGSVGGYGRWSSPMLDRLQQEGPENATTPRSLVEATAPNSAAPPTSDPDAEEIIIKNIEKLPVAGTDQLERVDNRPVYMPFQEQICCGRYDEASLMREDQMREHCYSEVFREPDQSSTSNGHLQGWNKFSCNSTHNVKQKIQCVHMCLWQARGTFQENETGIEESKLRDYIRKSETQQWRTDLLDKAVTKCLMDYEKGRENSNENKSCSSIHLDLSYCLWEELQLNCPDQEWNSKSRYCSSVVSHLHSRRKNQ